MKKRKLIILLFGLSVMLGCSNTGIVNSGELVGASLRSTWFEPVPYGMAFINRGVLRLGTSDEDPAYGMELSKTVSIEAFWMDDTEITNNEYRQFTNWVRDSIAKELLVKEGNIHNNQPDYEGPFSELGRFDDNNNFIGLNWDAKAKIKWKDSLAQVFLDSMYYLGNDIFQNKRRIDKRRLRYSHYWIDYKKAAKVSRTFDYSSGLYLKDSSDRSSFIKESHVLIYPDTLCWIRDFTYSYNDPRALKYYSHPGFDNYPVVGVSWEQANSFCHWRSQLLNNFFAGEDDPIVMEYRLPTEWEWEWAARGGLQNSKYPWGGYYPRDQQGFYLANFKPIRGNYNADGHMYTSKVGDRSYLANEYGLYDMAGNVAEWTSSAYDELSIALLHDLNPDFQYDAKVSDPPALKRKVIRGGSWKDVSHYIQTSTRTYEYQDSTKSFIGFRCVRSSFSDNF